MYQALTVAKYVIDYTHRNGKFISNLKLQAVLYFLQAEFLVSAGNACFMERIEAWGVGPVVPAVYHRYSVFGSASIPEDGNGTTHFSFCHEDILPEHKVIINRVVDTLADYSATVLGEVVRKQTPWNNAYCGQYVTEITRASLKAYFTERKQEG